MKAIGSVQGNQVVCQSCKLLYEYDKSDWIPQHNVVSKQRYIHGRYITDDYQTEWKELRCPKCNIVLMKSLATGHWDKPDCSTEDVPQDLDENYEYSLL